jgi:4-diphosphocytidyl-2-C-methyl-D-erythritol kinase
MIYFPPCKINLGLHVLEKRADGYHDIETVMLEIPFFDALEIVPSESFAFSSSGLEIPGSGNLCVDAFRLMQERFGIGNVAMHLRKSVPMGGGLGGGSSDAAKTLVALNELFNTGISDHELEALAATLGSDCPFFIRGGVQRATGRGEKLEDLAIGLSGMYIVLVNCGAHVPTKDAYANIVPQKGRRSVKETVSQPLNTWKEDLVNDFEKSVFAKHPQLAAIRAELYEAGAAYAAMSGSGSTMFGLFAEEPQKISWRRAPLFERTLKLP